MSIDNIASVILDKLRSIAQTETIIGKPIAIEGATLIPVSKVSIGFGLGANTGKAEMAGSGGGLSVQPIAFLVVAEGHVKVISLTDTKDVFGKIVDLVPDALAMLKSDKR